jgi:hypothetical protein
MTDFAQFFGRFSKKFANLFARFQIYIYICTKNVAPNGRYSEELREKIEVNNLVFLLI